MAMAMQASTAVFADQGDAHGLSLTRCRTPFTGSCKGWWYRSCVGPWIAMAKASSCRARPMRVVHLSAVRAPVSMVDMSVCICIVIEPAGIHGVLSH